MHSVLFVRDAIFPHGIAKRASKLFESQKEVVKNKERPLGEIKWAMQSTWWGWSSTRSHGLLAHSKNCIRLVNFLKNSKGDMD